MKFISGNFTEAFPASLEPSLSWKHALKLLPEDFCEWIVYHGNPYNRLSYRLMTSTSDLPIYLAKAFLFLGKKVTYPIPMFCYDCDNIHSLRNGDYVARSGFKFTGERCVVSDGNLAIEIVNCDSCFEIYFYKM